MYPCLETISITTQLKKNAIKRDFNFRNKAKQWVRFWMISLKMRMIKIITNPRSKKEFTMMMKYGILMIQTMKTVSQGLLWMITTWTQKEVLPKLTL